jgi:hypothetical protein
MLRHNRLFRKARRVTRADKKRQALTSGGLTIAITGADGAGKTTVISHLVKWLSWRLTVSHYYLGSSQPSISTGLTKSFARATRKWFAGCRRLFGDRNLITRIAKRCSLLAKNISYVAVGRDRYRRFVSGQRGAGNAVIVFYERYPIEEIRINGRPADGPRIAQGNHVPLGWVSRILAQAEERYYQRIPPPERLLILQVSPEVSISRKPDHRRLEIEAKSQAMRDLVGNDYDLIEVDADQPLEQVLNQVKSNIWSLL